MWYAAFNTATSQTICLLGINSYGSNYAYTDQWDGYQDFDNSHKDFLSVMLDIVVEGWSLIITFCDNQCFLYAAIHRAFWVFMFIEWIIQSDISYHKDAVTKTTCYQTSKILFCIWEYYFLQIQFLSLYYSVPVIGKNSQCDFWIS